MTYEKQVALMKLGYEWFKGTVTGWSSVEYFRIPPEKQLFSSRGPKATGQKATVAKVVFDTRNEERKLFNIEIQDSSGTRILKKNCNSESYDLIINDIKSVCEDD